METGLRERILALHKNPLPRHILNDQMEMVEAAPNATMRAAIYVSGPLCPQAIRMTAGAFLDYLRRVEGWSDQKITGNAKHIVAALSQMGLKDQIPDGGVVAIAQQQGAGQEIF